MDVLMKKQLSLFALLFLTFVENISAQISLNDPSCFNDQACIQECLQNKKCTERFQYESRKIALKMLYDTAFKDEQNQDYYKAFESYKFVADSNLSSIYRTASQYEVARKYKDGEGTEKDIALAIKYFNLSIENAKNDSVYKSLHHYGDTYFQLSLLYNAVSPYQNKKLSKKNLILASKEHMAMALHNLANNISAENEGFKKDEKVSYALRILELKCINSQAFEEAYGSAIKNLLEKNANEQAEKLSQKLSQSDIDSAKKLSIDEKLLFKTVEKLAL